MGKRRRGGTQKEPLKSLGEGPGADPFPQTPEQTNLPTP